MSKYSNSQPFSVGMSSTSTTPSMKDEPTSEPYDQTVLSTIPQLPLTTDSALDSLKRINDSHTFQYKKHAEEIPRRLHAFGAIGRRTQLYSPDAMDPEFIKTPNILGHSLREMMELETMDRYSMIEVATKLNFQKAITGCECGKCDECHKWLNPHPPELDEKIGKITHNKRAAKWKTIKLLEKIEDASNRVGSLAVHVSNKTDELSKFDAEIKELEASISKEEERIGGGLEDVLPLNDMLDFILSHRIERARLETEINNNELKVIPRKEKIIWGLDMDISKLEMQKEEVVEAAEREKKRRSGIEKRVDVGDLEYEARWCRASLKALEAYVGDG